MVYPKSVDEQIIEAERNELLYQEIAALPEVQRRRFLLYYDEGYNFREIGEMEGCSKTAILKSVYIARDKIRKKMEV